MLRTKKLIFLLLFLLLPFLLFYSQNKSEPFSFIITSDIHYAVNIQNNEETPKKENNIRWQQSELTFKPLLNTLKEQVNEYTPPPVFWINTGDLYDGYDPYTGQSLAPEYVQKEIKSFITEIDDSGINIPILNAKGNHEVKSRHLFPAYKNIFLPFMQNRFQEPIDNTYFSFNYGNSHFIILDVLPDETDNGINHNFDLGEKQLKWLENDLMKNKDSEHIFVFQHVVAVPPVATGYLNLRNPERGEKYLKLLLNYHVRLVFAGHRHTLCILEYKKENNSFVQVMTNTKLFDLQTKEPENVITEKDIPGLIAKAKLSSNNVSAAYIADFAPNITRILQNNMPGYIIAVVDNNRITLNYYAGVSKKLYKQFIISRDPETRNSVIDKM